MADVLAWIGGGFVVVGVALSVLGAVGVLRFPDVYTRIHAASITDTGGASLVLLGLCLISGFSLVTLKLALIWAFVMLTAPVAANALANAAFGSGHKPRIGAFQIVRTDERRKTPRGTDAT
ncbi:MAG TPA: monovalent cation/H(+) antiporter subunit G [Hyphomonadaceae bacterium]|nr:monovalent cation/H(+) antiporter subunit G [Hyphomonadaceae bacterium]